MNSVSAGDTRDTCGSLWRRCWHFLNGAYYASKLCVFAGVAFRHGSSSLSETRISSWSFVLCAESWCPIFG